METTNPKVISYGKVTRESRLHGPERKEFTVDIRSSVMIGVDFQMGGITTFEVPLHGAEMHLLETLDNLRKTDQVEVTCEKVNNEWVVTGLIHKPTIWRWRQSAKSGISNKNPAELQIRRAFCF